MTPEEMLMMALSSLYHVIELAPRGATQLTFTSALAKRREKDSPSAPFCIGSSGAPTLMLNCSNQVAEIVMLFGLARRTARQIEKVSLFYVPPFSGVKSSRHQNITQAAGMSTLAGSCPWSRWRTCGLRLEPVK